MPKTYYVSPSSAVAQTVLFAFVSLGLIFGAAVAFSKKKKAVEIESNWSHSHTEPYKGYGISLWHDPELGWSFSIDAGRIDKGVWEDSASALMAARSLIDAPPHPQPQPQP